METIKNNIEEKESFSSKAGEIFSKIRGGVLLAIALGSLTLSSCGDSSSNDKAKDNTEVEDSIDVEDDTEIEENYFNIHSNGIDPLKMIMSDRDKDGEITAGEQRKSIRNCLIKQLYDKNKTAKSFNFKTKEGAFFQARYLKIASIEEIEPNIFRIGLIFEVKNGKQKGQTVAVYDEINVERGKTPTMHAISLEGGFLTKNSPFMEIIDRGEQEHIPPNTTNNFEE